MSEMECKDYVKRLLANTGWELETAPPTTIGGVDLIAQRPDEMGLDSIRYVHCKNYPYTVGVDAVRELHGVLPRPLP